MPKNRLAAKLPVDIFKEGNHFIAYCLALDISTSAESLAEVRKMFAEMVNIFFEEVIKMGTMDKVLSGERCPDRKGIGSPQNVNLSPNFNRKFPSHAQLKANSSRQVSEIFCLCWLSACSHQRQSFYLPSRRFKRAGRYSS